MIHIIRKSVTRHIYIVILLFFFNAQTLHAQELFPLNFPASTLAKGTLGVRVNDEAYKEGNVMRNIGQLKVMYGLLPNLTVQVTGTVSNYHSKLLPLDFVNHDHSGGKLVFSANTPALGVYYPYIYDGTDLYAQYRFLHNDGQNSHLRMAVYGEGSYIMVPSHETEPILSDHTSGIGAGLITTYLVRHFAVSLNAGYIHPFQYSGNAVDQYGGTYPTKFQYGDAAVYNLSFGYLLFPRHYTGGYKQTNWNIYMEFIGKSYGAAVISQKDSPFPFATTYSIPAVTSGLKAGNYIEAYPGVQCIIRSNLRIDLSAGFPVINKSYLHEYPTVQLGVQRYFFFHRKSAIIGDK